MGHLKESSQIPILERFEHDGESNAAFTLPNGRLEFDLDDDVAYITSIEVDSEFRRQGIASSLLRSLFAVVPEGGFVSLGTVTAKRPIGEAFVRICSDLATKHKAQLGHYRLDPDT